LVRIETKIRFVDSEHDLHHDQRDQRRPKAGRESVINAVMSIDNRPPETASV